MPYVLVDQAPQFKVGDRAKMELLKGEFIEGRIRRVKPNWMYEVDWDDGYEGECFLDDGLERV